MSDSSNIYEDAQRAMDGRLATDVAVKQPVATYLEAHAAAATGPAETRISIILPTTAYFMSGVRDFTMTIVQNMTGFSGKWAYRFQSIVDELCNNAIEHGSAPGKEVKVTFISRAGESVFVCVEDTGTGPSQVNAEEMYVLVKDRQAQLASNTYSGIRGRGLAQIVSQWTDELKFDNIDGGGLKVCVIKKLDSSEDNNNSYQNTIKLQ
ncbi:MAG: ATP-binding protein [Candidatus Peregrinibacteria bacterium]|nr:ATP-binding protein [Candidatus Peregrinibacteria bacterium]MDZ4245116.1 ATP-binding protein [Candidatus Gracilibacteria bacterium]